MAKALTPLRVKSLTQEGFHADGATRGLYCQVTKAAAGGVSKSWIFRYASPVEREGSRGKARWMGLGPCDVIGLAEARELAKAARRLVVLGVDPIEYRRTTIASEREARARAMTFAGCATAYLAEHLASFRNAKHKAQWKSSLDRADKAFGKMNVATIDTPVVIKFLEPIWRVTPETGSRMRGRIEKVLDWAKARGFREGENPARWQGHLEHLLSTRPKGQHHAAMPFTALPDFMTKLRERDSISARALELLILTATRTSETIGAQWREFDLDDAETWTIPAGRMKAGHEHVVPLSKHAVAMLKVLPRVGDFVFPSTRQGQALSNMAMRELMKGMDENGFTPHGFRSTFRDWAGEETDFENETIEFALAHHIPDKAKAAYRRYRSLKKRKLLMQTWSDFCEGSFIKDANVVHLDRAPKSA